ncbi:MAG: hypothetical protein GXY91_03710 [Clostridia bacterium]|nr:hypothetical protein [Clostridia bacterium]
MDKLQKAKMAGAISVLIEIEGDPLRKTQLVELMNNLQLDSKLSPEDAELLKEIEFFTTPSV